MTFEDFDNLVENTFETLRSLRASKGKEYANSDDRLDNFKRIAKKKGVSPLVVAGVFLEKHLDALDYYTKNGRIESESITGRIDDALLYLLLIKGLIVEAHDLDEFKYAQEYVGAPVGAKMGVLKEHREKDEMQYACWRCGVLFLGPRDIKAICKECNSKKSVRVAEDDEGMQ